MEALTLLTPEALEASGLKGIAIPEIKSIKLYKYEKKEGQYISYMHKGRSVTFSRKIEMEEFLNETSEQLNQCLMFLNAAYIKINAVVQPHIFSLEIRSARAYNEVKHSIDSQMILTRRVYANENWAYFKQIENLVLKLLQLISIGSENPIVEKSLKGLFNTIVDIQNYIDDHGASKRIS